MKVRHLATVSLIGLASPVAAQVPCVGAASVISVHTASFLLKAPRGWTFDCEAGKDQGPLTVLYRVGESWRAGDAVMYVSVLTERPDHPRSFAKRVDAEVADWRRRAPDVRVTKLPEMSTNEGGATKAAVRRFQSPTEHLSEIVAYVPRGPIMPLLTMSARSERAFQAALPAFRRFVQSYESATLRIVK